MVVVTTVLPLTTMALWHRGSGDYHGYRGAMVVVVGVLLPPPMGLIKRAPDSVMSMKITIYYSLQRLARERSYRHFGHYFHTFQLGTSSMNRTGMQGDDAGYQQTDRKTNKPTDKLCH